MESIKITVNSKEYELEVTPHTTLLELIRERLGLIGTKEGCSVGECGACTIIMDGKSVNACLVLAVQADGSSITTIEEFPTQDSIPTGVRPE
jgi:carbon-monoxide dehydrogenase small subunit